MSLAKRERVVTDVKRERCLGGMCFSLFALFPVSSVCGGLVAVRENSSVTMQSPEYPWPYRKAKSCSWRVCPPQGMKLEFNFTTFDLRTFDKLEIINGKIQSHPNS